MTATLPHPLTAAPRGRYEDDLVLVVLAGAPGLSAQRMADGRVFVQHCLRRVDDDLAELLAGVLAPITDDHETFRRAFAGVVVTSGPDPVVAWERFYRASLGRDRGYAEVHRHALRLLPFETVADLGCSFGFLALHLAGRGAAVIAAEPDPRTAQLLAVMSGRLRRPVEVRTATAQLTDGCVDAVALVHVLEHVDGAAGDSLLREALRLARRRVVVAVPYETTPTALYGHVRRMDEHDLATLGERTAWTSTVHEYHGGWLVLDRP